MIACNACGANNPLGTRYCRSCGAKIEIQYAQIAHSVQQTRTTNRADRLFASGRSTLSLAVFAFACALVLWSLIAPPLPEADLPPLFPEHLLPPNPVPAAAPVPLGADLLSWRRTVGPILLPAVGCVVAQVRTWQDALLHAQRADGSWEGPGRVAPTAIATLALQAYPVDAAVLQAAARARQVLHQQLPSISALEPLDRTLLLAALIDGDDLSREEEHPLRDYLTDGKAPLWQALTLRQLPMSERNPHPLLVGADLLATPAGQALLQLIAPQGAAPSGAQEDPFAVRPTVTTGEEALLWAFTAWHFAATPRVYGQTMTAWTSAPPLPLADADAACGPLGATAVAVLTATAALRVPPIDATP